MSYPIRITTDYGTTYLNPKLFYHPLTVVDDYGNQLRIDLAKLK